MKQGYFLEGWVVDDWAFFDDWAFVDDQVYIEARCIKVAIDFSRVTSERCFP